LRRDGKAACFSWRIGYQSFLCRKPGRSGRAKDHLRLTQIENIFANLKLKPTPEEERRGRKCERHTTRAYMFDLHLWHDGFSMTAQATVPCIVKVDF
jgi:hypothetical protein